MVKEQIEKRLVELQQSLEQIHANGNATMGAIQECQYWLSVLEAEETKVPNA